MSRMEMVMFAVLAVAVIALVVMLTARTVWTVSHRVNDWRTRRKQPDQIATLKAERDRLKAEHAMLASRMEVRIAELKERFVEQEADVNRARNRIGVLADKLETAAAIIKERDAEIATLKEVVAGLEEDLEKRTQALHEHKTRIAAQEEEIARFSQLNGKLEKRVAEYERQIAMLREEVSLTMGADVLGARPPEGASAQERLAARIAGLRAMARQLEEQREELMKSSTGEAGSAVGARSKGGRETGKDIAADASAVFDKLREAEQSAGKLSSELDKLDELWSEKLTALKGAAGGKARAKTGAEEKKAEEKKAGAKRSPAGKQAAGKSSGRKVSTEKAARKAAAKKTTTGKTATQKTPYGSSGTQPHTDKKITAAAAGKAAEDAPEKTGGNAAKNVVSLADRIRALKERAR